MIRIAYFHFLGLRSVSKQRLGSRNLGRWTQGNKKICLFRIFWVLRILGNNLEDSIWSKIKVPYLAEWLIIIKKFSHRCIHNLILRVPLDSKSPTNITKITLWWQNIQGSLYLAKIINITRSVNWPPSYLNTKYCKAISFTSLYFRSLDRLSSKVKKYQKKSCSLLIILNQEENDLHIVID